MRRSITLALAVLLSLSTVLVPFAAAQGGIPVPNPGCTPDILPIGQADPPMEPEPLRPVWCFNLTAPPTTRISGANDWIDEFDTQGEMQHLNSGESGYLIYNRFHNDSQQPRSQHFIQFNHWMVDTGGGTNDGTALRPDRSFHFENGKLIVEADVATGLTDYGGGAEIWPEITITQAAAPTTDIVDSLYTYGAFGGNWTFGCRLHPPGDTICSLESSLHNVQGNPANCNAAAPSRVFEISAPGRCGTVAHSGGGRFNDNVTFWRRCPTNTMDVHCRDRFRLELAKDGMTLYVNGHLYFQDLGWDAAHQIPQSAVDGSWYVYFSEFRGGFAQTGSFYRVHWDRLAINPHNPDGSPLGPTTATSFCLGQTNGGPNTCPHFHLGDPTPPPVATNTPIPVPTNTPLPPTATPTNTPVPAATATPTNTPVPAATATPTNTPVPATCEVWVRINGVEQWLAKPVEFCQ